MANERTTDEPVGDRSDVNVETTVTGPDQYRIIATATFETVPAKVWALLWDWERLVAVGLPGVTRDFQWLSGGPDNVPSTFQFEIAGATLKEEIYERTAEQGAGRYRLRYRTLEPALGVLEYDAILELRRITGPHTSFSATREVRLAPGTSSEILAGMVESETQCLKDHFAV